MIHIFVSRIGSHTFKDYLADWSGDIRDKFIVHHYENYLKWPSPQLGTYLFTDHERLSVAQLNLAIDYADQLMRRLPDVKVLNHPKHVLRRLGLLKKLSRSGINRFRAFVLADVPDDFRFPGFLRLAREHNGSASPLLKNRAELLSAAVRLLASGVEASDILAVEFCETRCSDGFYRKYSFFRIGDTFIPAHIIFSAHWVAKDGALNSDQVEEERRFHLERLRETWVRSVFDAASIDYGRIDFSICADGSAQVWEINTNPILLYSRANYQQRAPLEIPLKQNLAEAFLNAWRQLLNVSESDVATGVRHFELNNSLVHLPRFLL